MSADAMKFEDVPVISDTCLCTNVQRAARAIGRRFDEAFRPLDLTNWQFTLMVALYRSEPPTMNVVARDLATDRTTITANLKPLERRGLVRISQDEVDRRVRRITLTEDGAALLQRAYVVWREVQGSVQARLAHDDVDGFLATLRAVTAI